MINEIGLMPCIECGLLIKKNSSNMKTLKCTKCIEKEKEPKIGNWRICKTYFENNYRWENNIGERIDMFATINCFVPSKPKTFWKVRFGKRTILFAKEDEARTFVNEIIGRRK